VDAPMAPDLEIDLEQVKSTDFKIIGHRLEYLGLCPQCADKSNSAEIQASQIY
jgi:Fe2+ or Zn2+ uptake regulation protein